MGKVNLLKENIAKISIGATIISIASCFIQNFLDQHFLLTPNESKQILISFGLLATICSLINVLAVLKIKGRRKFMFLVFLLITSGIALVNLFVASFIGSIG